MSPITIFSENSTSQGTVCISVEEFENLVACKKELMQIKKDILAFLGEDL